MKKFVFIFLVLIVMFMFGCGKKQQALEETQEPMSMEALSTITTTAPTAPKAPSIASPEVRPPVLEPLPPAGPYKPTAVEIQTALKNAGYYTEGIDGKLGPKTKKAIEDFQKASGLQADGKIGPKTWSVLSKYLNPEPVAPAKTPTKKR